MSGHTSRLNVDSSNGFTPGGNTGAKVSPVEIIVKPVGSAGSSDALNQRGTIGWKTSHKSVTLNAAFAVLANCASSYGANV